MQLQEGISPDGNRIGSLLMMYVRVFVNRSGDFLFPLWFSFPRLYKSLKVVFYALLLLCFLTLLPFIVCSLCLFCCTGKSFLTRLWLVILVFLVFYSWSIVHHKVYLCSSVAIQIVVTFNPYQSEEVVSWEEEPLELLAVDELRSIRCS